MAGEAHLGDRCERCAPGFYLIYPMSNFKECKECNPLANCYGGNQISPKEGYSRYALDSEQILKCFRPNDESCLGGSFEHQLGQCAEGY